MQENTTAIRSPVFRNAFRHCSLRLTTKEVGSFAGQLGLVVLPFLPVPDEAPDLLVQQGCGRPLPRSAACPCKFFPLHGARHVSRREQRK